MTPIDRVMIGNHAYTIKYTTQPKPKVSYWYIDHKDRVLGLVVKDYSEIEKMVDSALSQVIQNAKQKRN